MNALRPRLPLGLLLAALLTAPAALAADPDPAVPAPELAPMAGKNPAGADPILGDAIYKAFHEKEGIGRIMEDFVPRIVADPRIGKHFAGINLVRLRFELTQQVCYLTGGPCEYTGKDMKAVHEGLGLQNADFNALAEDLQLSMDKEHVSFTAQNRLLAKLAPMQRVIVTK